LYWEGDFRPGWCVVAVGAFADISAASPGLLLASLLAVAIPLDRRPRGGREPTVAE
jgi:hypothetical protein